MVFGKAGGERDYAAEALGLEARRPEVVAALVGGTVPYLGNRPTLVFCAGVAHARQLAEAYRRAGVRAAAVDGGMSQHEQDRLLGAWKHGDIQLVCQDSLLGEGFDFPALAALVLAAPTASLVRYIQRLGRGTRLSPETGKTDCLVLEATAGRPDHRQMTLGDVQPVPEEQAMGGDGGGGGKRNARLVLLDPRHDRRWRWLELASGVYVCQASREESVWLLRDPNPAGSGLYRTVLLRDNGVSTPAWLPDGGDESLPRVQAQMEAGAWLREHGALELAGRNRAWHDRPATSPQTVAIARWNPALWRPDLTAGEASQIIAESTLRRRAPAVQQFCWPMAERKGA